MFNEICKGGILNMKYNQNIYQNAENSRQQRPLSAHLPQKVGELKIVETASNPLGVWSSVVGSWELVETVTLGSSWLKCCVELIASDIKACTNLYQFSCRVKNSPGSIYGHDQHRYEGATFERLVHHRRCDWQPEAFADHRVWGRQDRFGRSAQHRADHPRTANGMFLAICLFMLHSALDTSILILTVIFCGFYLLESPQDTTGVGIQITSFVFHLGVWFHWIPENISTLPASSRQPFNVCWCFLDQELDSLYWPCGWSLPTTPRQLCAKNLKIFWTSKNCYNHLINFRAQSFTNVRMTHHCNHWTISIQDSSRLKIYISDLVRWLWHRRHRSNNVMQFVPPSRRLWLSFRVSSTSSSWRPSMTSICQAMLSKMLGERFVWWSSSLFMN